MIRWGIIGPGEIARNFADGLRDSEVATLAAVAGRSPEHAVAFAASYGVASHPTPAALLADPSVDAVYIAAPNAAHHDLSLMALAAGKPVLCEKPAGLDAGQVAAMIDAARQTGLFWMEGYMYRFHPQIARMIAEIRGGTIGDLVHLEAAFGFTADNNAPASLWQAAAGGGAIMDVGGYPMSLARLVAGVVTDAPFAELIGLTARGTAWRGDVETTAHATLRFAGGFTARIATSIAEDMTNTATLIGTAGRIVLTDPWTPGRNAAPADTTLAIETDEGQSLEAIADPRQLFRIEAEAASAAIVAGKREPDWPGMGQDESLGNARALDQWRAAVVAGRRTGAADE